MYELFHPDGKVMRYGMKFANLMWLQLLTILCSLPIFTIGAAFTAMHKILLQIYRDNEDSVVKTYFSAFCKNFRQATIIWIGYLLIFLALFANYRLTSMLEENILMMAMKYLVPVVLIVTLATLTWVFPLQSRYHNTILGTVRMSFLACIAHFLYTVFNLALMSIPVLLLLLSWRTVPVVLLLGITVPGLLRAMLYSKVFDRLENTDWRKEKAEQAMDASEEYEEEE